MSYVKCNICFLIAPEIYCPVTCDKHVVPSVRVAGGQGVWRIEHCEVRAKDEDILEGMKDDFLSIQPECLDYFLIELQSG